MSIRFISYMANWSGCLNLWNFIPIVKFQTSITTAFKSFQYWLMIFIFPISAMLIWYSAFELAQNIQHSFFGKGHSVLLFLVDSVWYYVSWSFTPFTRHVSLIKRTDEMIASEIANPACFFILARFVGLNQYAYVIRRQLTTT